MARTWLLKRVCVWIGVIVAATTDACFSQAPPEPLKWLDAKAFVIPKHTAPDGEGYFSIVCGHNGRLYIGTHANAINSWLVEFDPSSER